MACPTGPPPVNVVISGRYTQLVLDLAILGLLEERGGLHGYEIRKQLREGLGLLANVSYGSLYPALARLEATGAVEAVDAPPAPAPRDPVVPPTGSLSGEWAVLHARHHPARRGHGRRSRKVYRITDPGRELFVELLAGGGTDDPRTFGLRVAFARHLPGPARLALLERRRMQLTERLSGARTTAGDRTLDVYAHSVVEHTADALEDDIRWLDRLIAAERSSLPAGSTGAAVPAGASRTAATRPSDDDQQGDDR